MLVVGLLALWSVGLMWAVWVLLDAHRREEP